MRRPGITKASLSVILGKFDEALEAFEKAIETDPQYAPAWSNKGVLSRKLGKFDEALKAFEKAIEINPKFAAAWSNKSSALTGVGQVR